MKRRAFVGGFLGAAVLALGAPWWLLLAASSACLLAAALLSGRLS